MNIGDVVYIYLFDLEKYPFTSKVAYNSKGEQVWWSGYCGILGYLPVKENTTYYYSNSTGKLICCGLVFYDKDKNILSNIIEEVRTFTTPANCKYIRFAMNTSELPTWVQIEKGSTATEYEPYKETTALVDMNKKNLFDKDTLIAGYVSTSATTDVVTPSDGHTTTQKIYTNGVTNLTTFQKNVTSNHQIYLFQFDKDSNIITIAINTS